MILCMLVYAFMAHFIHVVGVVPSCVIIIIELYKIFFRKLTQRVGNATANNNNNMQPSNYYSRRHTKNEESLFDSTIAGIKKMVENACIRNQQAATHL